MIHYLVVLDLEEAKTAQAKEIASLKKRVKKLERKKRSSGGCIQTGGMIDNIDQDEGIKLVDETQGRIDDQDMFKVNDLDGDEVIMDDTAGKSKEHSAKVTEMEVSTVDPVTTAGEVITTVDVNVSAALTTITTTDDELTLSQTLIEIKAAKPKAIITAATIVTAAVTRPKAKGVVIQEPSDTPSPKPIVSSQKLLEHKDKVKSKMVEPERPLKRKEQIMMDEQMARDLEAQLHAELEKEQRLARQREEETNIALTVD
ncbi:hypothetical protein Tco_0074722 [Tanacetum coccineum]